MKWILLISFCLSVGCYKHQPPRSMTGTHKVWGSADQMKYQSADGFTCATIERQGYGWIYSVRVLDWTNDNKAQDQWNEFNTFAEAENFAEKWCRP